MKEETMEYPRVERTSEKIFSEGDLAVEITSVPVGGRKRYAIQVGHLNKEDRGFRPRVGIFTKRIPGSPILEVEYAQILGALLYQAEVWVQDELDRGYAEYVARREEEARGWGARREEGPRHTGKTARTREKERAKAGCAA